MSYDYTEGINKLNKRNLTPLNKKPSYYYYNQNDDLKDSDYSDNILRKIGNSIMDLNNINLKRNEMDYYNKGKGKIFPDYKFEALINDFENCNKGFTPNSKNINNNINYFEDNENAMFNEKLIYGSKIKDISWQYKACKSLCKIKAAGHIGSGFLIKLEKGYTPLYCLMTNEHVVTKEMIKSNDSIEILYDGDSKSIVINLDENERFIKDYLYLNIDAVIIEILKGEIEDKNYYLQTPKYFDEYYKYINQEIAIIQFPKGKNLSVSYGKITQIENNYVFIHSASTQPGSSGSPILLKDSLNVIGIHFAGNESKQENYGNFIWPIIDSLKLEYDIKYNNKYIGDFRINKNSGNGKNLFRRGFNYIDQRSNNNKNGKGTLCDINGKIYYEGDLVNGIMEGYGKYFFENGNYYIGQFFNNYPHGKGTIYDRYGNMEYQGDFINGKKEGYGKSNISYKKYYEGQWFNDRKEGYGKLIYGYFGNSYYEGQWLNDQYNGKGILHDDHRSFTYEGDFVNGKRQGHGKCTDDENGSFYIGEWFDDRPHGKGIFYDWTGHVRYEGYFTNGKKDGYPLFPRDYYR